MTATKLTRRTLLAGLAAAPLIGRASAQADWPNRPVRVMVPYPPAGGADTTARILFPKVGEMWGKSFVIDNRGGAGGTIGEAVAAKADPDGYTLLYDATAFSVNPSLYPKLSFDYRKDFEPVFLASLVPNILVVTPSVPVKTMADVIALPRRTPDGLDMASSGNGTLQHLCLEMFARQAKVLKINHVPYRGGGLALNDVMSRAGEILLLQRLVVGRPDQGRQGQGDRAYRQGPARQPAGPAAGVRHAAGLRGLRMERRVRAARHAADDRARSSTPSSTRRWRRRTSSARFKQLNIDVAAEHAGGIPRLRRGQMKLWGGVVKEANIHLGEQRGFRTRRASPARSRGRKRRASCRRPAPGTRTRTCSGRPTNFPTRRGAATRRPTRRSRISSRCSITTAARTGWWCRATRTATTTAWCSTRSRAIRSGCAASPSPTRASRRKRCATGTELGMRGLRFHLMEKKPGYVRGVGLDVFEVFRKTMAELGWVMQVFCDWRLLQDAAPTLRAIARDMPVIVDHYGMVEAARGVNEPNFQALLRLVGDGAAHVKVSAPYRVSTQFPDYADARALHQALVAANPGAADVGHRLAASFDRRRRDAGRRAFARFALRLDAGRGGAAKDFGRYADAAIWKLSLTPPSPTTASTPAGRLRPARRASSRQFWCRPARGRV